MTKLLSLDLELTFGNFHLTANEKIPMSGVVGLSGPSGSGKTSLLNAIAGLQKSAKGTVFLDNEPWQTTSEFVPPHKRGIGVVFQEARLFPHLNVIENIQFGLRFHSHKTINADLIEALEIGDLLKRQVTALSGGEQRRVALARALAVNPQLMLLDEPMNGLDIERRARLIPFFAKALKAMECPALYVSHDQTELMQIADTQYCIRDTELAKAGRQLPKYKFQITGPNTGMFNGVSFEIPRSISGSEQSFRVSHDKILLTSNKPDSLNAAFTLEVEVCETIEGCRFLKVVGANDEFNVEIDASYQLGTRLWLTALGLEFCY
ncbi:ATP-binding cassette domain-containing protein [Cochlodiniinecator piscidefendens]|uniref:ATP-binding cassette domain-containing protein n=1 Tax=Cochlodiniinecator piscidefendens TaxID=2715756 RepID=UPI00140C9B37|nr:ATP-binding cassette domain-containing protein [Cochlodiniinecator piscidefendens]